MAEHTLTCSALSAPGSEPFSIAWTGLGSNDFATAEDFKTWARDFATDETNARRLLAFWYLGVDPLLANPSILLNATLTYDDLGGFAIQVGGA